MARVVVIFAILSLITGAMFWLAQTPSRNGDLVATLPVAASEAGSTTSTQPATTSEPSATPTAPGPADAVPPAEVAASTSVPPLPTTGAEANILQQSTTTSAQTGLVVEDVQAGGGSSISLKGRADPGATVKVSVNDKAAGEVIVGGTGNWSVSVDGGKDTAEPKIALELVAADGKVLDKTNFVFKSGMASAPPLSPQDHALITAQAAAPTPEQVHRPTKVRKPKRKHRAFRVREGESLWLIAERRLGDGEKWRTIYEANRARIGDDPDYLRPGTRLIIPS